MFVAAFGRDCLLPLPLIRSIDEATIDFGGSVRLQRCTDANESSTSVDLPRLLASQTTVLQSLAACVNCDFLSLLTGPAYCGKRTIVELLAQIANVPLQVMRMTSETDAQDLMGSYEQVSLRTFYFKI